MAHRAQPKEKAQADAPSPPRPPAHTDRPHSQRSRPGQDTAEKAAHGKSEQSDQSDHRATEQSAASDRPQHGDRKETERNRNSQSPATHPAAPQTRHTPANPHTRQRKKTD